MRSVQHYDLLIFRQFDCMRIVQHLPKNVFANYIIDRLLLMLLAVLYGVAVWKHVHDGSLCAYQVMGIFFCCWLDTSTCCHGASIHATAHIILCHFVQLSLSNSSNVARYGMFLTFHRILCLFKITKISYLLQIKWNSFAIKSIIFEQQEKKITKVT